MRVNYAIIFTADMKRAVAFYRDVLGMTLKFESPHWSEFLTEGATVALHQAPGGAVAPPRDPVAGTCRPGFQVADLDALHKRLTAQGVSCIQEPRDVFGSRVAQYLDMDGMVFSVGEARG